MELAVIVPDNESTQQITVSEDVFAREFNEALVHQIVVAYLAGGRAGTKAQKNRSAVRGSTHKPWKQKGTGRARAGTRQSPIWRSGGVTFAAKPRDYKQKVNKKMYRGAICSILSELVRCDRLKVVENFVVESNKTKALQERLEKLNLQNVLIISDEVNENLCLASRNLPFVDVRDVLGIDPVSLMRFDDVLITTAAMKQIEGWLQ